MTEKTYIQLIEESLSEFDYLYNEGVIFDLEEIKKLKKFLSEFNLILNDRFFKTK